MSKGYMPHAYSWQTQLQKQDSPVSDRDPLSKDSQRKGCAVAAITFADISEVGMRTPSIGQVGNSKHLIGR